MVHDSFVVPPRARVLLKDYSTVYDGLKNHHHLLEKMARDLIALSRFREMIAAGRNWSVLIIEAGMDAAGKDSLVKHVFYPMGCRVESFKIESFWALAAKGMKRDFLSRFEELMPRPGEVGVFNRSYYEHLTLDRVHPELLDAQHVPAALRRGLWARRSAEINNFERELTKRHCIVIKLFLHLSRREQKQRFLQRIALSEKQYKFDPVHDMDARKHWKAYRRAFEYLLSHTSTKDAPWFIVPVDVKWVAYALVARLVCGEFESRDLRFPALRGERKRLFLRAKRQLERE